MFPAKVLLATHGSAGAERAARMAKDICERLDSGLHVSLVPPIPEPLAWPETALVDPDLWEDMDRRAEADASQRLDAEPERLKGPGGAVAGAHARTGRPDTEVVAEAIERERLLKEAVDRAAGISDR